VSGGAETVNVADLVVSLLVARSTDQNSTVWLTGGPEFGPGTAMTVPLA